MLRKLILRKLIRLVLGIFHDQKTHVPSSGGGFLVHPCQIREKKKREKRKKKKEKHDFHVLFFESVDCCAVLCYV
jgi:hypothetical protein